MANKATNSLGARLGRLYGLSIYGAMLLVVVGGLVLPAIVGSYLLIGVQEQKSARAALNEALGRNTDILALGMQESLWNMNAESARSLGDSVMRDPSVLEIRVTGQNDTPFMHVKSTRPASGTVLTASREILVRGERIGQVTVEMDDARSQQELRSKQSSYALMLASQIGISLLLIVLFLNKRLIRPLRTLMQFSDRLSRGDFETPLVAQGDDELGRLGSQMDQMRVAIRHLFDISARVLVAGEGGLLSMAFDPGFAANGRVYVYYTDAGQNIVVERFTVPANANVIDPASGLVIIRIPHPTFQNHFGGLVAFGPDGYLYIGTGDGGGAGDPPRNAQNLNVLLGKMLRLDVSAASTAQPYAIPPGNPYINQSARRGEIWASGLRNPWRYSFDGNQLYIADVGQDRREEIDVAVSTAGGLNYGWNITEGTLCYGAASCDLTGLTAPVFEYDHGGTACSITGGFVYRGAALPELAGHYFYSDYCAGFLKSGIVSGGALSSQRDWGLTGLGNIVSFGRDGQGELYLISATGKIYRIARAG